MSEPIERYEAKSGVIEVYENKITISREGMRGIIMHGPNDKEIFYRNISSINVDGDTKLTIEENGERSNDSGGLFFGHISENSILFKHSQRDVLKEAKQQIERRIHGNETNDTATASSKERLQELEELHSDGMITDEEYEAKRSEIVDDL